MQFFHFMKLSVRGETTYPTCTIVILVSWSISYAYIDHSCFARNILPEPVATHSLAHILNSSTGIAQDFLDTFRPAGDEK